MKEHIHHLLEQTVANLKSAGLLPADLEARIQVDRCKEKAHGDLATNLAMLLAKPAGKNPRELAAAIIEHLPASSQVAKVEIAGPGFINFFFDKAWLAAQVDAINASATASVKMPAPQTVVVDYSAPNVAKEMAVHHIRSTVLGDVATRALEFLGHKVIRANHIGDWGTQFGMLIAYLEKMENESASDMELQDLEAFYTQAKRCYDEDAEFAERARGYVVKLQGGDEYCRTMWKKLVDMTMEQNQRNYDRLNVSLTSKDIMGESMYNDMLPAIADDLKARGLAVEDDGALVVYLDEFKNKDGEPMGVIIQKRDGGFLYTTTDIACAKYRYETLKAERVMYFIDSRQHQHLMQAWTIVRNAGYVPESVPLEHHAFGMMLGKDGRPYKTRSGGTVKLKDLLNEAEERAGALLDSRNSDIQGEERAKVINAIAMGAVKYADLSKNRTTDYVFDWDLMLSFEGNTAPYLQYAYTRIQSIFRKAEVDAATLSGHIVLTEEAEEVLAQKLLQFSDAVNGVADKGMPHLLCTYLYELSGNFMTFYEACPINKDGVDEASRQSRLLLCAATAKVLKLGLDVLGIHTLERM
ncbi:arginine--tRNA ligase [Aeromonas simiae]|uniref:arginine--tRNA ligase n=1 Tax=Aeromonas simiae TaxID=218936 RepID=UPI0005A9FAB8|nr:arginine--tRNA ligase [Aeromonas simiae]MDO2949165.1 arginine--tRNA ligase [Aeromonas simiae]MDO2952682.1 arginine--tRNA ligase [Aeromonas simiae]MDO2956383.1 arginine--tRNA ligase [Aeromonas simiae]